VSATDHAEDLGQQAGIWADSWGGFTPESEIRMWDFFGLRSYVLNHVPRQGVILEAGCGLGRYVFYLRRLGIEAIGLDFVTGALVSLEQWRRANALEGSFLAGNVTDLPFEDASLAGYISLGVVEHFKEGPAQALREAYRVLRPGGVAIVSTPSVSFSQEYFRAKSALKTCVKILIGYPRKQAPFFQHWYSPPRLRAFMNEAGFRVCLGLGGDLLYSCWELGHRPRPNSWVTRLIWAVEKTPLARFGAQSLTISYKPAELMHCYLCGAKQVAREQAGAGLPVCSSCRARYPGQGKLGRLRPADRMQVEPRHRGGARARCSFCGREFVLDHLFESHGFSRDVCSACLRRKEVNLLLSRTAVAPIWRPRGEV